MRAGRSRPTTSTTASSSAICTSCRSDATGGSFPARPPFVNALIGGWQFNGITTLQAGTPLSITANNTAGIFGARTQPNNNGSDPRLSGPVEERLDRYFDTTVYSQPAAFTFGNEPVFSPLLRAHGVRNFDLSLFKNFAVRAGLTAQFRIEALNAFNRVQFSGPEHQRDVDDVRRDQRPGQCSEAAAVRAEAAVVVV